MQVLNQIDRHEGLLTNLYLICHFRCKIYLLVYPRTCRIHCWNCEKPNRFLHILLSGNMGSKRMIKQHRRRQHFHWGHETNKVSSIRVKNRNVSSNLLRVKSPRTDDMWSKKTLWQKENCFQLTTTASSHKAIFLPISCDDESMIHRMIFSFSYHVYDSRINEIKHNAQNVYKIDGDSTSRCHTKRKTNLPSQKNKSKEQTLCNT